MKLESLSTWVLDQEARAMLMRLARVKPFALLEPMLPAAALSLAAQSAIERYLADGRRALRGQLQQFMGWLRSAEGQRTPPAEAQKRFTMLRLKFNTVLSQFDTFADAISQRSEHETGVWLSGLDVVATDALTLPGDFFEAPPVVCYLDRGPGAAIRRARTRMPGGTENPVAIIRIPRERMVGSGIASSLVHEVGHQGAALLELVESLRPELQRLQREDKTGPTAWKYWERWISEIVADFWAVARIGIVSSYGLMAVISLPRAFVFRLSGDDPHPIPWIRMKLSCAIGHAIYPHRQWKLLADLWESLYPRAGLDKETLSLLALLESRIPNFVSLLVNHRPKKLRGKSLIEVMGVADRQPARLSAYFQAWRGSPTQMRDAPPSLVFAVIGQARAEARLTPEEESRMLGYLLTYWALRSNLTSSTSGANSLRAANLARLKAVS